MVGLPEWGEKPLTTPNRNGSNWNAYYRDVNAFPMTGLALASRMVTGMQSAWNSPLFFEYWDRSFLISTPSTYSPFTLNMWNNYRHPPTDPAVATATINSTGDRLTIVFNVSATNGVNGGDGMTITPSGGPALVSYLSGSGSTTYVYDITGRTISVGEVVTLSYVNPGSGIGATTGGAPLANFTDLLVTNGSAQISPALISNGIKPNLILSSGF